MKVKALENSFQGNIIDGCYIFSLRDGIEDERLEAMCESTVKAAYQRHVQGVVFNLININSIDSYTINLMIKTSDTVSLMGIKSIWTGLKPGVISSILDFDVDSDKIKAAPNIEKGIEIIKSSN